MTDLASTRGNSGLLFRSLAAGICSARVLNGVVTFTAVLAFFIVLTATLLWPWLAHSHAGLIGPPEDNMNDFWNTWYAAVAADPAHFFSTRLLRFPQGTPLIYQSFAYPQVFAVVALSRAFGTNLPTLLTLQNLTILASFPLSGVGAFYLIRHLARSSVGGLIGGFVYAFNPAHIAQAAHHAGVASIEFLPFFALAYLLAIERRSPAWLTAAAIFCALSALSCWYYLFFCAYFMGFHLLYQRVHDHVWPRGWMLVAPLFCILSAIVILIPLIAPMVLSASPSVYRGGGNTGVADLLAYIAFPPEHLLSGFSHGLYTRFSGYPWEATVYLGFINLAVLIWWCLRSGFARDSLKAWVGLGMLTFGLLASGEALHIAGAVTFLHLPDVVFDKLPFLANVRIPSRAIVFVYLFMSVGIGAAAALAWQQRSHMLRAGVLVVGSLIVLDFYPANLQTTPVTRSSGLAVLNADREQGFGVLNLPFGYVEENSYMLGQVFAGRPMLGGVTAREMATTLVNHLSLQDLALQREQLTQAHVKYILLHRPAKGLYAWSKGLAPEAEFLRTYAKVYDGPDMTVLRVY